MNNQEKARLENLHDYQVLDSEPEEAFDRITRVAKSALRVPIALVSLVDKDRQWFKSRQGLETTETPRDFSFCTHAIRKRDPFIINDALTDERFRNSPLVTGEPNIRFYAGIPLTTPKGHNIGTLCAIDTAPRELSPVELEILQDLARLVVDELELRQIALTDSLTGAQTRRSFNSHLDREIKRAQRYSVAFSLITLDLDHFKSINDTHGHGIGDVVLQEVAARVKTQMRDTDILARVGGEEFALILPETGESGARVIAERLREAIAGKAVAAPCGDVPVTASFGLASFDNPDEAIDAFMARADEALYAAKRGGRNQVALNAAA